MFDWSQLITPAFITGAATTIGRLLTNLMNHKATENFKQQTTALTAVIKEGNAEIKGAIEGGNTALVTAIRELSSTK